MPILYGLFAGIMFGIALMFWGGAALWVLVLLAGLGALAGLIDVIRHGRDREGKPLPKAKFGKLPGQE